MTVYGTGGSSLDPMRRKQIPTAPVCVCVGVYVGVCVRPTMTGPAAGERAKSPPLAPSVAGFLGNVLVRSILCTREERVLLAPFFFRD